MAVLIREMEAQMDKRIGSIRRERTEEKMNGEVKDKESFENGCGVRRI